MAKRTLQDPTSRNGLGRARIDTFNYCSRRYNWPYCIQPAGKRWVILNRDYKPLNLYLHNSHPIKYVDYTPFIIDIPGLTDEVKNKLHHGLHPISHSIYLYNDGITPERGKKYRTAYIAKLELLADLLRKDGDTRDWREMFSGDEPVDWSQIKLYDNLGAAMQASV